jgi:hypothetical protein
MALAEPTGPGDLVLPLKYSGNWMHDNLANYGGMNGQIILDNYEASAPHFPIRWKEGMDPNPLLGNFNGYPPLCADIPNYETYTGMRIDYVLLWRPGQLVDSCSQAIQYRLDEYFTLVTTAASGKLYKRSGIK